MPTIRYEVVCPLCGANVTIHRSSTIPPPIYCGLACANSARKGPHHGSRKYHYTPEMEAAIRKACHDKVGSLKALWRDDPRFAHIPYPSLRRHAWTIGCIRSTPDTTWGADETAYCERLYLLGRPVDSIAQSMRRQGWHRSPGSIQARMEAIGTNRRMGDYWSAHQIAQGFNVDDHVIARWIKRYHLPVHHRSAGDAVTFIAPGDLRAWVIAHSGLVASVAVPDLVWFTALLCPHGIGDTQERLSSEDCSGDWLNGEAVRDRAAAD